MILQLLWRTFPPSEPLLFDLLFLYSEEGTGRGPRRTDILNQELSRKEGKKKEKKPGWGRERGGFFVFFGLFGLK